jgi:aldehyde:ferredoxin oxidoreductase
MARIFNQRCGFTDADDKLPPRFLEPLKKGPFADKPLTLESVRSVVEAYYAERGWDSTSGTPTSATLDRLGISEYVAG